MIHMPREKDIDESRHFQICSKNKNLTNNELKILYEKGGLLFQFLFNKEYEMVQTYLTLNPDLKEVIEKW